MNKIIPFLVLKVLKMGYLKCYNNITIKRVAFPEISIKRDFIMDSTILILFVLFSVIIILLGVCVALLVSLKKNKNDSAIFDELRHNREEMSKASRMSREDVINGLEKVDTRLNALREENYKSRIDMTEKITENLNVIRQNNIEQNDRQTRFIVESVAKLQESNEKKLEEMRVTVDEKLTSTLDRKSVV